jgi:hypothetical protein
MFCPKCRSEFGEGREICQECGNSLVKELSFETETTGRKLVEIFRTTLPGEAIFMESLLNSNGIRCFIFDQYFPTMRGIGAGVPMRIMVEERDKEKAKEIVEVYYRELREEKQ